MESMKQACLLNRVFIHFGLWCWDQRTVKNYKQTRGDLKVCVCVCAKEESAKNKARGGKRQTG